MKAKTIHESMYLDVYHFVRSEKILDLIKRNGFEFNKDGSGVLGVGFYSLYNLDEKKISLMTEVYSKYIIKYSIPLAELRKGFLINDAEMITKVWKYKKPEQLIYDEIVFPELVKQKDYPWGEPLILKNIPIVKTLSEYEAELKKLNGMTFSKAFIYMKLITQKQQINGKIPDDYLKKYFIDVPKFKKYWESYDSNEWDIIEKFENNENKYDDPIYEKIKETNAYKQLIKKGYNFSKYRKKYKLQNANNFLQLPVPEEELKFLGLRGVCGNYAQHSNIFFTSDKSLLKNPTFPNTL
jgi:hypothetical protein